MNVNNLGRYFKGYLTIKVEGLNLEKFMNLSVTRGINFWDVKRSGMTAIQMKLSVRDYRRLKAAVRKTLCRVSVVSKEGMPFFLSRLKKRKVMALGDGIFIFLVFVLSSFIWSIQITGVVQQI
jgi:similar to stage IV sporulation protein